jgi:quercetin dioxygenase-like cupin family protein
MGKMNHLILTLIFILFYMDATNQIPVYEESHHKTVLDNPYVRVLDLHIGPGDSTVWHRHFEASVVVFLTASRVAIQNHGKPAVVTDFVPGSTVYRNYDEEPVFHTVWIEDRTPFRCLVVEIKKHVPAVQRTGEANPEFGKLLLHKELVDAYSVRTGGIQQLRIGDTTHPWMVIAIAGTGKVDEQSASRTLKAEEFLFVDPGKTVKISAVGQDPFSCIVLKLR